MHFWGDEWFRKYGTEFDKAINTLESRMRKWAHVGVYGKEKFGTYRDEYLKLWDGGLHYLFTKYKGWVVGQSKWAKFLYNLDTRLIPHRKTKFGWMWWGLRDLNRVLGLTKLYHIFQKRRINKAFQITLKEYPHFINELVSCVDCYELIKPCRWGNADGTEIHNRYWTPITADDFKEDMQKLMNANE